MNARTYALKRAAANRVINRPTTSDWLGPTVTTHDALSAAHARSVNLDAAHFLKRAVSTALTCANTNARVCADVPVRLYRRKTQAGKAERARFKIVDVPVVRSRYLASGKAGYKSATWAEQDAGIEEVKQHPVLELINRPNPFTVGSEFQEASYFYREVCGHSFELMVQGEEGHPMVALALMPQHTHVLADDDDFVCGYAYGREGSDVRAFDADSVLMIKMRAHPTDPYYGQSPLAGILPELDVLAADNEVLLEWTRNGQAPPFVVETDEYAEETQIASLERMLHRKLNGTKGMTRALVLGKAKAKPLPINNQQAQKSESITLVEKRIRAAYGIPESMADKDSTNANARTGYNIQYLGGTVRPRVNRDAEYRTEFLLPMFGLEPGEWFLAADDPVPEDVEREGEQARQDVSFGVMTINEARAVRGLKPLPAGDTLRVNGTSLETLDRPAPEPGQIPVMFREATVDVQGKAAPTQEAYHAGQQRAATTKTPEGAGVQDQGPGGEDQARAGEEGDRAERASGDAAGLGAEDDGQVGKTGDGIRELRGGDGHGNAAVPRGRGCARPGEPYGPDEAPDSSGDKARNSVKPIGPVARGAGEGADAFAVDTGDILGDGTGSRRHPDLPIRNPRRKAPLTVPDDPWAVPCCGTHTKDLPTPDWIDTESEREIREAVEDYLREVQEATIKAGGKLSPAQVRDFEKQLTTILRPLMMDALAEAALEAVESFGGDLDGEDFVDERVSRLLDDYVPKLSGDITRTTREAVAGAVQSGLESGASIADIQKEIEALDFPKARAETIARTETQQAVGLGRLSGEMKLGFEKKTWSLAPGNCPMCGGLARAVEAAGGSIPIEEPFGKAGETITGTDGKAYTVGRTFYTAPAHPNCRCTHGIDTRLPGDDE